MAEEQDKGQEQQEQSGGGGLKQTLLIGGIVVIAAIVAALSVYLFVLKPRLNADENPVEEKKKETLPETMTEVNFDSRMVSMRSLPDSNLPAPTLIYQVTFVVDSPETAAIIEKNKSWFENMLLQLHSGISREQANDPLLQQNIEQQALIKANEILKTLPGVDPEKNKVLKVNHIQFMPHDNY